MPSILDRIRTGIHAATAPTESVEKAVPAVLASHSAPISNASSVTPDETPKGPVAPMQASVSRPDPGQLPVASTFVDALRYQFSYGQNARITPRQGVANPFAILRQMSEYGHIRTCIEARKDQMTSLNLDIRRKDKLSSNISDDRISKVRAFFLKPDKKRTWNTWLRLLIEEVLVTDALSIYRRKTFGGDLYSLEIIDGSTVLPMIDARGDTPEAPLVAYRQVIYGKPVEGGDMTVDDLLYRPRLVRTHTPYGMSPIEWVLMAINSVINRDVYNLVWYTEGNLPDTVIDAPSNWTPEQILEFERLLNLKFSGNLGERRKMKVLSQGMASSLKNLKEPDFTGQYDEWLLKVICAAFAVPPSELGFTDDAGSRNTSKQQENVVYRRGVKPLANFIQDILNEIIAFDLNEPGIEAILTGGEPEDKLMQAQTDQIYIDRGVISPDEVAQRMGLPGVGLGRFIMTGQGPAFVEQLVNQPGDAHDDDPALSEPKSGAKPDGGSDSDETDDGGDPDEEAVATELKKYRTNAISRAKQKKAPKLFVSTILPDDVVKTIHAALTEDNTVGNVVRVFQDASSAVHKASTDTKKIIKLENRMRKMFVSYFAAQGEALAKHLEADDAEKVDDVEKGDKPGHPFHGNQYGAKAGKFAPTEPGPSYKPHSVNPEHRDSYDKGYVHGQTGYGFQKRDAGRRGTAAYDAYNKGHADGGDDSGGGSGVWW